MQNPFVYGEIVPDDAFVDREVELDRLVTDLAGGQKVFLISPRRYGKSSLVRQALGALARQNALTAEVTVSSYSSYLSFLEGYAGALAALDTKWERTKSWFGGAIKSTRPELRYEPKEMGLGRFSVAFPLVRIRARRDAACQRGLRPARAAGRRAQAHRGRGARRVPGRRRVRRGQRGACAARRRPAAAAASATSSPDPSRA